MNVTIVTPRYPPPIIGGGEISVKLLATSLSNSKKVDNVQVLSFDGKETINLDTITVKRLGRIQTSVREISNVRAFGEIRKHMYNDGVIHSYNMDLHPAVGLISKVENIPTVATLNSYPFFKQNYVNVDPSTKRKIYELVGLPTTGKLLIRYLKEIDKFIPLSNSVRDIYTKKGFDKNKMEVIPNMVDDSFIEKEIENVDNGGEILYVGALRSGKGVKYLVDSVGHLPKKYHLNIVGDGKLRKDLEERAREKGLGNRITFAGSISHDRLPETYINSDIFVHPGVWPEPLNRTIFEAMQAQLPVVCTNIGGPPEVIPQQELHVEPRNPTKLAKAIQFAYGNKNSIGHTNQQLVYNNYSQKKVTDELVKIYESI